MGDIVWAGCSLPLVDEAYNTTVLNERAVELAVARWFLDDVLGVGLEVGNVTGHYWPRTHDCVDLSERADGVRNVDVFEVSGRWDWLLSVSTVEHVWWDDRRDPVGAVAAVEHMRGLADRMLVTVPLGWNPPLDGRLPLGADRWVCFRRSGNGWVGTDDLSATVYGPRWANAVWVGEWL